MCILYYIYKYILSKQSYLHINLHWLCKLKKELASEEKRFFSHECCYFVIKAIYCWSRGSATFILVAWGLGACIWCYLKSLQIELICSQLKLWGKCGQVQERKSAWFSSSRLRLCWLCGNCICQHEQSACRVSRMV